MQQIVLYWPLIVPVVTVFYIPHFRAKINELNELPSLLMTLKITKYLPALVKLIFTS